MPKEINKEAISEKVYEIHIMNQQASALQQQLKILESNLAELNQIEESLEDIGDNEEKEIFSHLGGGVFVKAETKHKGNALINIGGGVLISKSIKEAKETVKKQGDETGKIIEKFSIEINSFLEKINNLEKELEDLREEE